MKDYVIRVAVLMLAASAIGLSQKSANSWKYLKSVDAITAKTRDGFVLVGKWAEHAPSFPYQSAIPSIIAGCQDGKLVFATLDVGAQLDAGTHPLEFRIDDIQGRFEPRYPVDSGDKAVLLRPEDFMRVIEAKKVIFRASAYRDTYFTMSFEMPSDISQIKAKCDLAEIERLVSDREERRMLGGLELSDYEFHGLTVPVPNGSDMSKRGQEVLHVFMIATMGAIHQFYDTSMRKMGWLPSNAQGNCWAKAGTNGGLCLTYVENGVDLSYQTEPVR